MKNCLNIGMITLYQSMLSLYLPRYTMHDPEYRLTIERANNPAPPPMMSNWPPVHRGRRSRDRHWYA